MSKVVILGIDGLDPFLLHKWKKELPNIGESFDDIADIIVQSTFPPDSICAWTSIYTGENPAEHGLIESIDYLSDKKDSGSKDRSAHIKGRTFWDAAGKEGKSVCVINPFMAYPAWNVNGIMVSGPVFEGGTISAFPESVSGKYDFPALGGIVDFPEQKKLAAFLSRTRDVTMQLADVSFKIYKDYNPDLFFTTFLTLDRVKHFIWRYTDEDDIYYPGENSYKGAIKEFYIIFDAIIGRFRDALGKDTTLLVISDHGHRRRCSMCLNLNEILRRKGYIKTSGNGIKKIVERAKVLTISTLSQLGLQDGIYKIAKFIPNRKALKKSTYLINRDDSPVSLSNLCGTNPYGGLDVHAESEEEYERLREKMIRELMELNKSLGGSFVKWAGKREEIYIGKHKNRLPDVLFELNEEYGVGMDFFSQPVTPNFTHKKISGGHKREAVLLVCRQDGRIAGLERPRSVINMKDYIMKILNSDSIS